MYIIICISSARRYWHYKIWDEMVWDVAGMRRFKRTLPLELVTDILYWEPEYLRQYSD